MCAHVFTDKYFILYFEIVILFATPLFTECICYQITSN